MASGSVLNPYGVGVDLQPVGYRVRAPSGPGWELALSSAANLRSAKALNPVPSITSPVVIDPPFEMPANIKGLTNVLNQIAMRPGIPRAIQVRLAGRIVRNFAAALCAGRAPNKVTIVLLGETGQGKSSTINKLVGQRDFFKTGRLESTTKEVQSVQVPVIQGGITFPLMWDDTPGLYDTTFVDRGNNASILRHYRRSFSPTGNSKNVQDLLPHLDAIRLNPPVLKPQLRQEVFPNAILLINTWRDIKSDVQCEPGQFTTSLGRAVWAVKNSGLYDEARPNVIVVVTKSLSDPTPQLEAEAGSPEFDEEWEEQARLKRKIVQTLQASVFPNAAPWPIVLEAVKS